MSKYCPLLNRKVVYLTCLECEEKFCKEQNNKTSNVSDILKVADKKPQKRNEK